MYNHIHNILRLFDVLGNSLSATSETMCNYASRVSKRLKDLGS